MDFVLWIIEKPAKYAVDGERKNDMQNPPWPIFWTVLFYLNVLRVVLSMVLVQLNKEPIEPKDIITKVQTWRRTLRSIRFRGLRNIRESKYGKEEVNGEETTNGNGAGQPHKQPYKKRNFNEMSDSDLLDELVNRTFSDTDHMDSTYMGSKLAELSTISTNNSTSGGQTSEDYQSPVKPKYGGDSQSQDNLTVTASESNLSTKSNEMTSVSTVDDTEESAFANAEKDSIYSRNGNGDGMKPPGSNESNGAPKIGKESLNQPINPVDAMMAQLVEKQSNGKVNVKGHPKGSKKKRQLSLTGQKDDSRPYSKKESKSQESLNTF